jgi:Phospholipase_D-nuclease N-terminal
MLNFLLSSINFVVSGVFGLAFTAFWFWMLLEAATKEPREGNERLVWIIIIAFVPYMGAIAYYLVRRPVRIRTYEVDPSIAANERNAA